MVVKPKPGVQERILLHLSDFGDFMNSVEVPYQKVTGVPFIGDKLTFNELQANILLDEDMKAYDEMYSWMRRNLDRRIEAVTPIENLKLKTQLYNLLQTYINDNYYSWVMDKDGNYKKKKRNSNLNRSQFDLVKDL